MEVGRVASAYRLCTSSIARLESPTFGTYLITTTWSGALCQHRTARGHGSLRQYRTARSTRVAQQLTWVLARLVQHVIGGHLSGIAYVSTGQRVGGR
eukprot:3114723-Rhodomonas_salina.2